MKSKYILPSVLVAGGVIAGAVVVRERYAAPPVNLTASTSPDRNRTTKSLLTAAQSPDTNKTLSDLQTDSVNVPKTEPISQISVSSTATNMPKIQPGNARAKVDPVPTKDMQTPRTDSAAIAPQPPEKELTIQRLALSLVGTDSEAEQIWTMAINDPLLPASERKDLIEDLNEDGFPDPKHITVDDVPLILSRIELIEQLAPTSMDEVNASAFGEAYKDLVEMLD